jgi:hypothetical protein
METDKIKGGKDPRQANRFFGNGMNGNFLPETGSVPSSLLIVSSETE